MCIVFSNCIFFLLVGGGGGGGGGGLLLLGGRGGGPGPLVGLPGPGPLQVAGQQVGQPVARVLRALVPVPAVAVVDPEEAVLVPASEALGDREGVLVGLVGVYVRRVGGEERERKF